MMNVKECEAKAKAAEAAAARLSAQAQNEPDAQKRGALLKDATRYSNIANQQWIWADHFRKVD